MTQLLQSANRPFNNSWEYPATVSECEEVVEEFRNGRKASFETVVEEEETE